MKIHSVLGPVSAGSKEESVACANDNPDVDLMSGSRTLVEEASRRRYGN